MVLDDKVRVIFFMLQSLNSSRNFLENKYLLYCHSSVNSQVAAQYQLLKVIQFKYYIKTSNNDPST